MCDKTQKGIALHDSVGSSLVFSSERRASKGCQLTIQPAFEHADSAFFVYSTRLYFRFFFCISARMLLSFFVRVVGLATKCPVKENFWSRKGGFNWTKNDGNAHPLLFSHCLKSFAVFPNELPSVLLSGTGTSRPWRSPHCLPLHEAVRTVASVSPHLRKNGKVSTTQSDLLYNSPPLLHLVFPRPKPKSDRLVLRVTPLQRCSPRLM